MIALEIFLGGVLGLAVLIFVVVPLVERYSDQMWEWYNKYLDKWRKK